MPISTPNKPQLSSTKLAKLLSMTWFDALLVTLLAMITAFGARNGLTGLFWGISGVAICLIVNIFNLGLIVSLVLAVLLGGGIAFAMSRLVGTAADQPLSLLLGGIGGACMGFLLVVTLALSFPIELKNTADSQQVVYPSTKLAAPLRQGIGESFVVKQAAGAWNGSSMVKTLFVPDRVKRDKKSQ